MIEENLRVQSSDKMISPELQRKLATFYNQRVLNLESYKKNGNPVRTPVVFVEENGCLYFQTARKAWKAKRIRGNHEVRITPSTFRGEPKGNWVRAKVTHIEGEEAETIRRDYIRKLGLVSHMFLLIEKLLWGDVAFFSIALYP
jgi:uncharacterized protein